jgi:hypothetical protein
MLLSFACVVAYLTLSEGELTLHSSRPREIIGKPGMKEGEQPRTSDTMSPQWKPPIYRLAVHAVPTGYGSVRFTSFYGPVQHAPSSFALVSLVQLEAGWKNRPETSWY